MRSFLYAFLGIRAALKSGRNLRIMTACAALAIVLSFVFGLSGTEWAAVLICCAGTLSLEMINTSIETVINGLTHEYKPQAKKAKDIAAGAVLVFSVFSLATGLVIFVPRIIAALRV